MFYRLDENKNIIDCADFKYAEDCLETEKKIIRDFNGKLVFEEETQTQEYLKLKQEFEKKQNNQKRIAEIKKRLEELSQDFVQVQCGADFGTRIDNDGNVINIADERISEFQTLHNELRALQGKEPREYNK